MRLFFEEWNPGLYPCLWMDYNLTHSPSTPTTLNTDQDENQNENDFRWKKINLLGLSSLFIGSCALWRSKSLSNNKVLMDCLSPNALGIKAFILDTIITTSAFGCATAITAHLTNSSSVGFFWKKSFIFLINRFYSFTNSDCSLNPSFPKNIHSPTINNIKGPSLSFL